MTEYFRLLDSLHHGTIVKSEDRMDYEYRYGTEEWVRSALMAEYHQPDSSVFEKYSIITQAEAEEYGREQRLLFEELLGKAKILAVQMHMGQTDKGGHPYSDHLKAVAKQVNGLEQKTVAWLHDILEDTHLTIGELREAGFTPRIIQSVEAITKVKGRSYKDYLMGVMKDDSAWHVKQADIKNNLDLSRINHPTQEDYDRLKKYEKALAFLQGDSNPW